MSSPPPAAQVLAAQFGQLLDAAGWQLAEVTVLPSGQSLLNASAR